MTRRPTLRAARAAAAVAIAATTAFAVFPGAATTAIATTSVPVAATPVGVGVGQVGTWGTAADATTLHLVDQTVRNIIRTSVGGSSLRISVSNAFGSVPVTFDSVWVGSAGAGAAVVEGTNRQLAFSGRTSVTVPVGAEVLSDALPGDVPEQSTLAVSIHVVGDPGRVSGHQDAHQTSWISARGDFAADERGATFTTPTRSFAWVESAVVEVAPQIGTVIALGDSITDGDRSTAGTNRRWPDVLARRVLTQPALQQVAVMNMGISGNRVLTNGSGVSALARFDRDVLAQPDVRTAIVLEGVNDLRLGSAREPDDLIGAYRQLLARAHARGLCLVGGTLTPWEGSGRWSSTREATRRNVNEWIRTSGEFDAVVDFDAAVRDPQHPTRMRAAYDSGDHLHPSDAGYEAMGNAVPLTALDCRR